MAVTYSEAEVGLTEIANRIVSNRQALQQSRNLTAQSEADLTALQTQYAAMVGDIDAALAAAPNDIAFQNLKAKKDKLVADFTALKGKATQMKNALAPITF